MSGLALPADKSPISFNDCSDTSVGSLAAFGVINGVGNGNFAPNDAVANAHLAVIIYRTLNLLGGVRPVRTY